MFGYVIKKKSKKQEVIDSILVLSPLLIDNTLVAQDVRVLVNDKLRELIKEL